MDRPDTGLADRTSPVDLIKVIDRKERNGGRSPTHARRMRQKTKVTEFTAAIDHRLPADWAASRQERQIPVRPPVGNFWIDLGWPEQKVGCEYDGVEFHTGKALTRDRQRYNALTAAGWLMLGVTGQMVWNEPARLVGDIAQFLDLRRVAA